MATITRFFYVSSRTSKIVHLSSARVFVEGEQAYCGRRVRRGWGWWYRKKSALANGKRLCVNCMDPGLRGQGHPTETWSRP